MMHCLRHVCQLLTSALWLLRSCCSSFQHFSKSLTESKLKAQQRINVVGLSGEPPVSTRYLAFKQFSMQEQSQNGSDLGNGNYRTWYTSFRIQIVSQFFVLLHTTIVQKTLNKKFQAKVKVCKSAFNFITETATDGSAFYPLKYYY